VDPACPKDTYLQYPRVINPCPGGPGVIGDYEAIGNIHLGINDFIYPIDHLMPLGVKKIRVKIKYSGL
jgi:hypothetical protein